MVNKIIIAGLWIATGFMSISGASRPAASSDLESVVLAQMELKRQHQLELEQLKKYLAGRTPAEVHPLKAIAFGEINWDWVRNSWDAYDKGALLRAAIIARSTSWITCALDIGADINAFFDRYFPDESDNNYQEPAIRTDHFNPLQYAVVLGYADVVRLLLSRGADKSVLHCRRGQAPKSVRQLAQEHGHTEIIGILDLVVGSLGWFCANAMESAEAKSVALCQKYLPENHAWKVQWGGSLSSGQEGAYALLIAAVRSGCASGIYRALQEGIPVNAILTTPGYTALHWAAYAGQADTVRLLIRMLGADPNKLACGDYSPLHVAADRGHLEAVKALIAFRAQAYAKTALGETPSMLALKSGHKDIVEYLATIPVPVRRFRLFCSMQ